MLNKTQLKSHRCSEIVEIFHLRDGEEQRTIAIWNPAEDLADYMAKYERALESRGLTHILPFKARVVTRGGKVMAKWSAAAAPRMMEQVA